MQRFGEKLRLLRQSHNMTLTELAKQLNYQTHSYISEIESGRKAPTVPLVIHIADVFGLSTDELLRDEIEIAHLSIQPGHIAEEHTMPTVFAERFPTQQEFERFRLVLSTYQDGSGMLAIKGSRREWITRNRAKTLPGWRDFERSVAIAFDGIAVESKYVYDVLLANQGIQGAFFGVSCKMRGELRKAQRIGRASIELSNAAGEFWDAIKHQSGLTEETYDSDPNLIGKILIDQVNHWHRSEDVVNSGKIETTNSLFLNLLWDEQSGEYQLFQFPIKLTDPADISWQVKGRRLVGIDQVGGILFEWYGFSGGQLKYYPAIELANWHSERFSLEPLPESNRHVILEKAASYYEVAWSAMEKNASTTAPQSQPSRRV